VSGAGEALQQAAIEALAQLGGLAVYDGPPLQAAFPYAVVETDLVTGWGHKTGCGFEVRLAVTVFDEGERRARLRSIAEQMHGAVEGLGGQIGGWKLVSLVMLRERLVSPRSPGATARWAAVIEYRARMLAE
jgi:hypothetical protein